jgi:hypothetical protein
VHHCDYLLAIPDRGQPEQHRNYDQNEKRFSHPAGCEVESIEVSSPIDWFFGLTVRS